jgi:hypothetical protein
MKLHIKRHMTAKGGMSAPALLVRMRFVEYSDDSYALTHIGNKNRT